MAVTTSVNYLCNIKSTSFLFILVPKDPKPQWRRVAWSYDCTLLAYAESTGTVRVFDLMGSELFVITPVRSYLKVKTFFFGLLFVYRYLNE